MYNSNTESLGLILGVEVFFSLGHCLGALCADLLMTYKQRSSILLQASKKQLAEESLTLKRRVEQN